MALLKKSSKSVSKGKNNIDTCYNLHKKNSKMKHI